MRSYCKAQKLFFLGLADREAGLAEEDDLLEHGLHVLVLADGLESLLYELLVAALGTHHLLEVQSHPIIN
jgi:hypothetical protein